jgi:hypothetical protein
MNDRGLTALRTFARELQSEGYPLDRDIVAKVLKPLGIAPKPMLNGRAKGLDGRDRAKIRRFFRPLLEPATAN